MKISPLGTELLHVDRTTGGLNEANGHLS